MDKKPNIFVIIVTYKGMRWYDKCFFSLRESTIPVQTVVVDNSPSDEDVTFIKEHFPEVHIIKTDENLGFGRANNLGMRYAMDNGCDYVFLLNQDAWIEQNTIEKLVNVAEKYPRYGIISPIHLNAERTAINMNIGLGTYYRNDQLLSDLYLNRMGDVYDTNFVNAAAWLLPRNTLETIGGFCPLIYHYGEDDDYLNRAFYHRIRVGVVPSARIVHDSQTRVDGSKELFAKANRENLDVFLNINSKTSVRSWRRHFFWNIVKGMLLHKNVENEKAQYKVLCAKQKDIEKCRAAHKIKQANWL